MVCYEYLKTKYVQKPFQKVPIVNWKYIYVYCSDICKTKIEKNKNIFSKYNLKIKSTNNKQKYFNVKSKQNKKIIYNLEGKPVSCISDTYNGKKITANEKDEKVIANIIPINKRKYKVEFTNLITNKPDFFEMKTDEQFKICGIYYRKKSEGFSLICKIERDQYGPETCGIEMAPSVDITILFTLAVFFNDINDYKKHLNRSSGCYDIIKSHPLINDKPLNDKNKYHVFKHMQKEDSDSVFSYISYDNDTESDEDSDSEVEIDNENFNGNKNESGSNKQLNSSFNILNTCNCDDQFINENNNNDNFENGYCNTINNSKININNDSNNKTNEDENNTSLDTINNSNPSITTDKCHKYEYSSYQYSHDTLNDDSYCYDNYGAKNSSLIDLGFNNCGFDDCGCDDCGSDDD